MVAVAARLTSTQDSAYPQSLASGFPAVAEISFIHGGGCVRCASCLRVDGCVTIEAVASVAVAADLLMTVIQIFRGM